jgi:hypothetical protein
MHAFTDDVPDPKVYSGIFQKEPDCHPDGFMGIRISVDIVGTKDKDIELNQDSGGCWS